MSGQSLPLVLIGGGGHCRVVIDAASCAGMPIAGLLDNAKHAGNSVDAVPVLGGDERLQMPDADMYRYHVAIASTAVRQRLRRQLDDLPLTTATILHPGAMVSALADIRPGCFLAVGAIVNPGSRLAPGVLVNTGAQVDHDVVVGADCHIGPGAVLCGGVQCGSGVFVGAGATVIPGVSVGDGATVGAGATVIDDVSPGTTVVGTPAAPIQGH